MSLTDSGRMSTVTRATTSHSVFTTLVTLLTLTLTACAPPEQEVDHIAESPLAMAAPIALEEQDEAGFLYGRVSAYDGATYQGRLRWGGDEEAFWGDYFNGTRDENPLA